MTLDNVPEEANGQKLTSVQKQALQEALQRKKEQASAEEAPKEIGGSTRGVEPTRYGDWEKDGRAYDF